MIFNVRISIDSAGTQRYTEEDIYKELSNDNIKIDRKLLIRKHDGAVMGEILIDNSKTEKEILTKKIADWDELAKDNVNNKHNLSTSERQDWVDRLIELEL